MLDKVYLDSYNARLDSASNALKDHDTSKVSVDTFKRIAENLAAVAVALTDTNFQDASYIDDKLIAIEKALQIA